MNATDSSAALILVLACLCPMAYPGTPNALLEEGPDVPPMDENTIITEKSVEEKMKELRIEMVKFQILSKLNLKEAPPSTESPSQASKEVIRLLMREDEEKQQRRYQTIFDSDERLVIHAKGSDFECLWYNDSSCRRFELRIPKDVIVPSLSEFWIYKTNSTNLSENLTLLVLCSRLKEWTQKVFEHKEILDEKNKTNWLSFQFPTLEDLKFWQGNVICSIEITGIEMEVYENKLPFMKMTKDMEAHVRKKRTEVSTTNDTCKSVQFTISFQEIGFGDWIIYPEYYVANICKGYCLHVQNHHETFMDLIFERNKTLELEYGRCWSTCCRPKEYATLYMIYRQSDDTYACMNMTNMIVSSCSCS